MNIEWSKVEKWLEVRPFRDSIIIFLTGFLFFYVLWGALFKFPLNGRMGSLREGNQQLEKELQAKKNQLMTIQTIVSHNAFLRQKAFNINNLQFDFVPVKKLTKVTNDIISQQSDITLIDLKTFPQEPWLTKDSSKPDIFKYKMQIEFQGNYFTTLEFLSRLEKLSWHLYADSLEYKVLKYPTATVIAEFYVLSNEGTV